MKSKYALLLYHIRSFKIFLDKIVHALFISPMSAKCIAHFMFHLQVTDERKGTKIGSDEDVNHVEMTSDEYKWH
jgi:hypothetical protein